MMMKAQNEMPIKFLETAGLGHVRVQEDLWIRLSLLKKNTDIESKNSVPDEDCLRDDESTQ